jgi:hypothetical protein
MASNLGGVEPAVCDVQPANARGVGREDGDDCPGGVYAFCRGMPCNAAAVRISADTNSAAAPMASPLCHE